MSFLIAQAEFTWDWAWFRDYLPTAIAAVAVLVVGWVLALIVSAVARMVLRRTGLDDRLSRSLSEEGQPVPNVSRQVGSVVFWVLMLLVFVAFLHTLNLAGVAAPLNNFLGEVFAYAPRLLAAVALVVAAWIVATILRLVVRKSLEAADLDRRLRQQADVEPAGSVASREAVRPAAEPPPANPWASDPARPTRSDRPGQSDRPGPPRPAPADDSAREVSVARAIADATYWLVWLLFLPAILDALALSGLLVPVQNLVSQVLGFLPNLLAAAAILLVGWFLARVVQRIVTNLLAAVGTDRFGEQVGVSRVIGSSRVSDVVGLFVHVLILIPVLIAALNALRIEAVTAPASVMLARILAALPNIFAAVLIVTLAYVLGRLVGGLVAQLLGQIGFDRLPVHLGLTATEPVEERRRPSYIAGTVVTVAVILVSAMQALHLLGFEQVEVLVAGFLVFAGQVLLGLVVFGVGLYAARFVGDLVESSGVQNAALLGWISRVAILALAGAMALQEMGLASTVVNLAFGLTFGALAVAAAIAFGVGGRDAARRIVESLARSYDLPGSRDGEPEPPVSDGRRRARVNAENEEKR